MWAVKERVRLRRGVCLIVTETKTNFADKLLSIIGIIYALQPYKERLSREKSNG